MGGDAANDAILIVLEDIERCFEAEEEALASMTLKLCLSSAPGREGVAQLVDWLGGGRLQAAEIFALNVERENFIGLSDRLTVSTIGRELLR